MVERPGRESVRRRRIEIVHESLLTRWPRLVRWQAQDEEGAVLRDQLRQAAQLWEVRGRSEDLLWTGTAFREYALWRERYPGGLSESEEAFAEAARVLPVRQVARHELDRIGRAGLVLRPGTWLSLLAAISSDETAPTGYTLDIGPFPGWEEAPEC